MTTEMRELIRRALEEDVGSGDVTTNATIETGRVLTGVFRAKANGIIAGLDVMRAVFAELDPQMLVRSTIADGAPVSAGIAFAEITGNGRALLTGERTALNFLQRMSGIATATRAYVEAVHGTGVVILDTRKTAPGLRTFDKLAVRLGGGSNHRIGLFDMVLIKDNHIDGAGGIGKAVQRVRTGTSPALPVEVECRTLAEVEEAAKLDVERIMLDNMDIPTIREAVRMTAKRIPLEISGNVTIENIRALAETGVQFISVGALTHSVRALDISLKIALPGVPAATK